MRILILGHKGMLGNVVYRYINNSSQHTPLSVSERYPDTVFLDAVKNAKADVIINCIGAIPQKKLDESAYQLLNVELPTYLETLGIPIIHPSTDCEFAGTEDINHLYTKESIRDASDAYGKSKAEISERIEKEFKNTKIIRTSIIGHELITNLSLLDWFLSQEGTVRGYTNHYWNGITTLEWAKQCITLLEKDNLPAMTQLASPECLSKYEILTIAKEVYQKEVVIEPFETEHAVNKCLLGDMKMPPLKIQLEELCNFYEHA